MINKYNEEKLKYIPITSNSFLIFLRIALIFFGAMLFLGLTYTPTIKYITNTENVLIVDDENEFSIFGRSNQF